MVSGLRVEYRVAAKLGDCLTPTIYQIAGGIIVSLSIGSEVSAIGQGSNSSSNSHHAPWLEAKAPFEEGLPGFDTPKPNRRMGCE